MNNTNFTLLEIFSSLYTIAIKLFQSLPLLFSQFHFELWSEFLIQKEFKVGRGNYLEKAVFLVSTVCATLKPEACIFQTCFF